jgi:competence protein ComEC
MADPKPVKSNELVLHVLNVGRGDTIVVELPADREGQRSYGVVDCYDAGKVTQYINRLRERRPGRERLEFLCATHPHSDHILGIPKLLETPGFRPQEFWDSGFRHASLTYIRILEALYDHGVQMLRVSSGMEWYFERVRITALAPSVMLRNTYGTYGVDVNNASIVLRVEHHKGDLVLMQSELYQGTQNPELIRRASPSTVILGGDAEFDSWARINEEFPMRETTRENEPLVKRILNMLSCSVLKVPHHGSMHSIPLEVLERMRPSLGVISTEQKDGTIREGKTTEYSRSLFPHPGTISALMEICSKEVLSTDGKFDWPEEGECYSGEPGSVVIAMGPGGRPRWRKLDDTRDGEAQVLEAI